MPTTIVPLGSEPTLPPVGRTPLVEVEGVLAKLECTNPCGSLKDRIAVYILEESERRGLLRPGTRIVEARLARRIAPTTLRGSWSSATSPR